MSNAVDWRTVRCGRLVEDAICSNAARSRFVNRIGGAPLIVNMIAA
jgi:hypothetical protein